LINALSWGFAAQTHDVLGEILRTSAVQVPEFEGWKKLSVEAIILAKESNALQPAK
jgi:hypothetical protein